MPRLEQRRSERDGIPAVRSVNGCHNERGELAVSGILAGLAHCERVTERFEGCREQSLRFRCRIQPATDAGHFCHAALASA
jgi:hypothetical protein